MLQKIKRLLETKCKNTLYSSSKKIFIIGSNKTGTTSLQTLFAQQGFEIGDQRTGELLLDDWGKRDFQKTIRLCETAEVFQDIPFSLPDTYKALDHAFPNSKFILTIRDNSEVWFDSLCRFHTKILGKGRLPTWEDLSEYDYCAKGWLLKFHQHIEGVNPDTLYDRELYRTYYEQHIKDVTSYFSGSKKHQLLVINLSDSHANKNLASFLNIPAAYLTIPHENKST